MLFAAVIAFFGGGIMSSQHFLYLSQLVVHQHL